MKHKELFSSIINYFSTNYDLKTSGRENIKLGSRTHNVNQFTKRFIDEKDAIADHIGMVEWAQLITEIGRDKGWKQDRVLEFMADRIFSAIKTTLAQDAKQKVTKADLSTITENAFDYTNHLPIMDIKTNQQLMFDTARKCIDHNVAFVKWRDWVMTRDAEEKKILMQTVTPASIFYNPRNIEEVQYKTISGQENVLHLNAHRTPDWRKTRTISKPELPSMFVELMEHVFADQESIEYVYAWIYFALTDRNHCYLLMHADQGLGKGTLCSILSKLVGDSNFATSDKDSFESRFNGELKNKRIVYFDELDVTLENMPKIRALTNKYVRYEGKGEQAADLENFASFIIANNSDTGINHLTCEDRRFSVPNMGKGNIDTVKGQEWLDRIYHKIEEDQDFIANIGWWILDHGDNGKYTPTRPFKSDTFYDLVENALTIWQRNVLELIESRKNYRYDILKYKEELRGTGRIKLANFLENHKDREGDHYGYVGQDNDGKRYIYVSDKYRPQETEKEDNSKENEEDFNNFDF
jgi:hypothetical protein